MYQILFIYVKCFKLHPIRPKAIRPKAIRPEANRFLNEVELKKFY